MRKSLELKQQADAAYEKGKAILATIDKEKREPTDQERTDIDALTGQMDKFLADAKRYEKMEAHEIGRRGNPNPAVLDVEDEPEEEDEKDEKKETAKVFPTLGHQLQAVYTAQTGKLMAGFDTREQAFNKLFAAASGAGEAIDSEGGHLVQRDLSSVIEQRMTAEGTLLGLLNFIEVAGNGLVERYINETSRATGSRSGAVRAYWIGEGDDITDSKVKFDKRSVDLGKLGALAYFSEELLADATALTGIYNEAFSKELRFMVEDGVIEGDGNADKPLGIIGHSGTVSVAKATGQAADTFINQNISDMWVRRHVGGNYVWLINSELGPQIDSLYIPAGVSALEPRFVSYGPDGVLRMKGRPVIELEYCSAPGDVGDVILADFSGYRIIRKGGPQSAMSMHVKFISDQQTFRVTYRVGGQPKDKTPITPFKGTLTRSNFITLAAR